MLITDDDKYVLKGIKTVEMFYESLLGMAGRGNLRI